MKRVLVYDVPTRVFHWLFVLLFLSAFSIAKFSEDEAQIFYLHMICGLTLVFLVFCRLIWAGIGTRYARFGGFELNLKSLQTYLLSVQKKKLTPTAGHNPASSWAAITMMVCALSSACTGILMTSGTKGEWLEECHEISAYSFVIVAILHVLGIVIHTIRFKDMIGLSMLDGKKAHLQESDSISHPYLGMGLLLGGVVLLFGFYLHKNYDAHSGKLEVFGAQLQLTEIKKEEDH